MAPSMAAVLRAPRKLSAVFRMFVCFFVCLFFLLDVVSITTLLV